MLANAAALWVATWLFSGISLTGSDTLDPFGSQQPCRVRVHPNLTSGPAATQRQVRVTSEFD